MNILKRNYIIEKHDFDHSFSSRSGFIFQKDPIYKYIYTPASGLHIVNLKYIFSDITNYLKDKHGYYILNILHNHNISSMFEI